MARALWKGYLTIGELSCAVALHAAASTSGRVAFHIVNRKTGNRVRRDYVDEETGKPVPREDQVKGYETAKNRHVILEPEEIAAAIPESDKRLAIDRFIACDEVDTVYFDKPYFVTPADEDAGEAFALIREGMRSGKVAAVAKAVLFRRLRTVLLRPRGCGLMANTLNFDYEVQPAQKAFADIPELKIQREMLDLARHIIDTKRGKFDPAAFDDRYDAALAELVRAKIEGKELPKRRKEKRGEVIDLMEALRQSAAAAGKGRRPARSSPRRKAG